MTTPGLARVRASAAKLMDPSTRPRDAAAIAAPRSRDPVDRRQRPRRRGERHRRVAARAVGARRPLGLRGAADPRRGARRHPADAEPGRPRGRHAPQRLRLRHEPRLVRAHAARDRRQARDAAPLPAGAVHRRARDGRQQQLLLPAQRRPDLPRDRPTRRSPGSTTSTARAKQDLFDARGIPYFNYDTYDLFYQGYGDTVPATGFGAAGMTYEKSNGDAASQRVFQQYLTQWNSLSPGRAQQAGDPHRLARRLGRGRAPGPRRRARAERGRAAGERGPAAGARHQGAPLLPPRRRPGQGARGAGARPPAAADGRRGAAADAAAAGAATTRRTAARRATRCCPPAPTWSRWTSARSTGSRRCSTRTPTCRSRTSTTSRRWSQPLLFNVAGGYSGRRLADLRSAAGGRAGRPGRAGRARGRPADRAVLDVAAVHARDRVRGLAALPARPLGARSTPT